MSKPELSKLSNFDNNPLVSICCVTYNHESFIKQTLDGFLMQETNFAFEIVIHDDASTDDTGSIIREYSAKYPSIFKPLLQTENQRSKFKSGMNPRFNYPRSKGKYIALCEGDDYWTDPLKLQKQVDFLENNPEYVACFHGCKHITENNELIKESRYSSYPDQSAEQMLIGQGAMITHTVMFRNIIKSYPPIFEGVPSGDTLLYHLLGFHGSGKFIADIKYSAYRIHNGGVFSGINDLQRMKNTLSTMAAIQKNLIQHFGKDTPITIRMTKSTFNNIRGYLYNSLYHHKYIIYLSMLKLIINQQDFSKYFLLKEHFKDIFIIIKRKIKK